MPRVLHVLSQRPSLTGSGVTLDALVRHATDAGWEQRVVVGVPADDPLPEVGGLDPARVHPLRFETPELDFPVPGMSDVMPYPSTRFSAMAASRLEAYRSSWMGHLAPVIAGFEPDLIHSHHLWIVSSLLKDVAPRVPVLSHCHATGFRQMELCPHLREGVRSGLARNERFLVLHRGHAERLTEVLEVAPERVTVIGAGYRDDLFHPRGREPRPGRRLLYIGKYSAAKGVPSLLEAVARLARRWPDLELHVAGSGAGDEAEALRGRMHAMAPLVRLHGQLAQPELAELMRRSAVCVLPSLYEGVPLVLVEALACGCRLVATRLPGVESELLPHLDPHLELVPKPAMVGIDTPAPEALPAFVDALCRALETALAGGPVTVSAQDLEKTLQPFTWAAVFHRVEAVWRELLAGAHQTPVPLQ